MNKFSKLDCAKKIFFFENFVKLRTLRKSSLVLPPTKKMQFPLSYKRYRNTSKRTTRALSLRFTYPTWIVNPHGEDLHNKLCIVNTLYLSIIPLMK